MQAGLFGDERGEQALAPGAFLFAGMALARAQDVLAAVEEIAAAAPWRQMLTPGGRRMSVAMTNCGALGWITDRKGYRYTTHDPDSGRPWPAMPAVFAELAASAARQAGFDGFEPDACIVNRYVPGARMSLHQDKDERDFGAPIVSVSLGLPAVFLFGGLRRADKPLRVPLAHGDVVVWGGPARLRFHGVLPLPEGTHPALGAVRINLTLRQAGRKNSRGPVSFGALGAIPK